MVLSSTKPEFIDYASKDPKITATGRSGLPERLKNRVYPSRSTEDRLQNIRNSEHTAEKPVQNPFQSAKSKYAADCIRQGKEVDPSIKKSLGGRNVHSAVSIEYFLDFFNGDRVFKPLGQLFMSHT